MENQKQKTDSQKIKQLKYELAKEEVLRQQASAIGNVIALVNQYASKVECERGHKIIDSITWRIKTAESIAEKLRRKGWDISYDMARQHLGDLIGIRIVCPFRDDVYRVADFIKENPNLTVIKDKDYVKHPKKSGYQSLHLIIWVPVFVQQENVFVRVEIQIRSLAMNLWAKIDHQLCYKQYEMGEQQKEQVREQLLTYAKQIDQIDQKMAMLRSEIGR